MRFHELHGKNILFDEQRLVATRFNSFTHAMIFSERPLYPGELFIVEIEDITDRWTGHIKIGFTLLSPNEILNQCTEEVVYDHILHIPGNKTKQKNLKERLDLF
jgi:neuralized-like protein 2